MAEASAEKIQFLGGERHYFSRKIPPEMGVELNRLLNLDFSKSEKDSKLRGNSYLENRLIEIKKQWPACIDPYIALFKFYFRVGRYPEGERVVWQVINMISERNSFTRNYGLLKPCTVDWLAHDSEQRHFLFCLKALGVIRLRRGRVNLAHKVLSKLLELDPHDEIGGGNFLYIAESLLEGDANE